MSLLGRALRVCIDTALPPHCLACAAEVGADGQLCPDCFSATAFISPPFCSRCGMALPGIMARQAVPVCESCAIDPPRFRAGRAALLYDEMAKRLILPFKYSDRPEAALGLARLMARPGAELLRRADIIVPVPLHRARLRERGYNQAALLARALGRIAGKPVSVDALRRPKRTRPLNEMGRDARRQALEGAIAIRPDRTGRIAGASVLLVDDVMTSGATATACAEALLSAGAAAVDVLALARVTDPQSL
ncbi:MAG TPA: ComF family protein [Acetobacteraceae bacterium]|nr:ComF family protein [Acetobacteraceae bacterium]